MKNRCRENQFKRSYRTNNSLYRIYHPSKRNTKLSDNIERYIAIYKAIYRFHKNIKLPLDKSYSIKSKKCFVNTGVCASIKLYRCIIILLYILSACSDIFYCFLFNRKVFINPYAAASCWRLRQ